jgi:hypothetical protein
MGVHWGNQWYRVQHKNLNCCGIIMLSKYPTLGRETDELGIEKTYVPIPNIPGLSFWACESKQEAQREAKLHIYKVTSTQIIDLIRSETEKTLLNEQHRLLAKTATPKVDGFSDEIRKRELEIAEIKQAVKGLKRIRRAKVPEFLESELVKLVANLS